MKTRSLALMALLSVAVSANAATLIFNHSGTVLAPVGTGYFFASPTSNDLGTLPTTHFNFLYDPIANSGSGQIFHTPTGSVIDVSTTGAGPGFTIFSSGFESSVANVVLYNGIGIFSGLTGTGTISLTRTYAGQIVQGAVSAELVPEPASMAILGLGVAALARRRRKQA